jgi:hypothetical protein
MDILTRKIKNTRKIKKRLKKGQAIFQKRGLSPFFESEEVRHAQTSY